MLSVVAAAEPEIASDATVTAASDMAPRLRDPLLRGAADRANEPSSALTTGDPPSNLTPRTVYELFANKLAPPFTNLTRAADKSSSSWS